MLASALAGCSSSARNALPLGGGTGSVPAGDLRGFLQVRKSKGALLYPIRRTEVAQSAGDDTRTFESRSTGVSVQADRTTQSANMYDPNNVFTGQFTSVADGSGAVTWTLTRPNTTAYTVSMPSANAISDGTTAVGNGSITFSSSARTASGSLGGYSCSSRYDSASDSVVVTMPDGTTATLPNVSSGVYTKTATTTASARTRHPEQQAMQIIGCILMIIKVVILIVLTLIALAITIAVCLASAATLGGAILGTIACFVGILVTIFLAIWTVITVIQTYTFCTTPPPPPAPPGPIWVQRPGRSQFLARLRGPLAV